MHTVPQSCCRSPGRPLRLMAALGAGMALLAIAGCSPATPPDSRSPHEEHADHGATSGHNHDHAHHDHEPHHEQEQPGGHAEVDVPRDYPAAVERINSYCQRIVAAIKANQLEQAHEPLDDVDVVLEKLMLISRDSNVPRSHWETINVARRELRTQLDRLHATIDDGQPPDLGHIEPLLQSALQRLQRVADTLAAPPHPANNEADLNKEEAKP